MWRSVSINHFDVRVLTLHLGTIHCCEDLKYYTDMNSRAIVVEIARCYVYSKEKIYTVSINFGSSVQWRN